MDVIVVHGLPRQVISSGQTSAGVLVAPENPRAVLAAPQTAAQIVAAGQRGQAGPMGPPGEQTVVCTAGQILSGHRAVYGNGSLVLLASADDLLSAECCLGISLNSALQDEPVTVQRTGIIEELTWAWSPGPVFLGMNGVLTQEVPQAGVVLQIGVALSASQLDIRMGTVISLD